MCVVNYIVPRLMLVCVAGLGALFVVGRRFG